MIKPYKDKDSGKKEQVAQMFNSIARRYDFLNHFLSFGIDKRWRKKAVQNLKNTPQGSIILDVASGTGDFAISSLKLKPKKIIGIDISEEMLKIGVEKINRKGYQDTIELKMGDSENLEFNNNYFDAVTVAFGVRNFENLNRGLSEMHRVLKPGGRAVILEFSKPKMFPVKHMYNFYFKTILPLVGKIISKDNSAYTYLPESVNSFPEGTLFIRELESAGFNKCNFNILTFGIATIYAAVK